MSAYRLYHNAGLVAHLYEPRGVMTILEDDRDDTHQTLMLSLCRSSLGRGGWCDDTILDRVYPPLEGDLPDRVCPHCARTVHDRARPIPDTPSLLDMLQEAS